MDISYRAKIAMKYVIFLLKSYLVYNIHLGRLLADKRIRGAEGGRRLIRNSPGEEEPDCVTSWARTCEAS